MAGGKESLSVSISLLAKARSCGVSKAERWQGDSLRGFLAPWRCSGKHPKSDFHQGARESWGKVVSGGCRGGAKRVSGGVCMPLPAQTLPPILLGTPKVATRNPGVSWRELSLPVGSWRHHSSGTLRIQVNSGGAKEHPVVPSFQTEPRWWLQQ